jgi:ubiquinone/menaquinone biosynthesis C-methylase UbiE
MSLEKLHEHREVWRAKPVVRRLYEGWFRLLAGAAPSGRVVEIGAGPGFLAEWAAAQKTHSLWVATDLLPAPWNQVAADATRLPFRSGSIDAVVGIDVLHHLAEPRLFFEEAARVLGERGAVVLVEPWVTPLSYPIYRWLHPEGCDLRLDPWRPFAKGAAKEAF